MIRLSNLSDNRRNNFDVLRLLAALAVIYSHSFPLLGVRPEPLFYLTGYDNLGNLAVRIFFVMSGFLITKSWITKPDLAEFALKRFLRIYPAIIVCTLFTVFILCPFAYNIPLLPYLVQQETIQYLQQNLFLLGLQVINLSGVFSENPIPCIINGSLWTLPVEMFAYFFVAVLGASRILSKRFSIFILTITLAGYLLSIPYNPLSRLWLILYFLMGSIYYLYKDKVTISPYASVACIIIYLFSFQTKLYPLVSLLTISYLVFAFAYMPFEFKIKWPAWLNYTFTQKLSRQDLSYGFYIYAWPIQQLLVLKLAGHLDPVSLFGLSICCVLPLAAFSWHFIEKPALALKQRWYSEPKSLAPKKMQSALIK